MGTSEGVVETPGVVRLEMLGTDSSARTYWFLGRRLFVMGPSGEVLAYYSTPDQVRMCGWFSVL